MDFNLLWQAVILVVGGTLLLRIAGRKSISQMSLAQVVIMIGIGSLLVQPIAGEGVWSTLMVGLVLVLSLVVMEYAQIKIDGLEKLITGRSKLVIKDGELQRDTLKKLRLTVDQLEMKLRQNQIRSISDVEEATLEPSGQLGFILKQNKQPATKEEINLLKQEIQALTLLLRPTQTGCQVSRTQSQPLNAANDLFDEVSTGYHSIEPPEELK
ncbi:MULTISPECIES: DUF421 domain-containing protein [Bacillaceae]|uniref:DUF421 domain-containing protein n=1 Tax=Bacillaceae TaxID=186817 RepID=UPI001C56828D|nr:YetF domain-containing protein [Rossellomorea sp. YZS02]MBW3114424.1 DUF421 domain-containing protein [Bacillus sp. MCCB 382]MDX8344455.1 DUF421 domain-containing protein [Rossellomorea sp. YZS02]